MEQFGIWNLLKTMLNNSPATASQAAKTAENQAENPSNATKSITASTTTNTADSQQQESKEAASSSSANACEEYLLRHERLTNGRKR